MEYICTICGKPFETVGKAKYCVSCRAAAYRKRNTKKQQERRAQMYAAERAEYKKQAEQRIKDRKQAIFVMIMDRRSQIIRDAEAGDLLARLKLAGDAPDHYYRREYWTAFKAYNMEQNGRRFETVVNGISVSDPDFEKCVIDNMQYTGKITISIEQRVNNGV